MAARSVIKPWFAAAFILLMSCGDSNGASGDADADQQEQPADTPVEDVLADPVPDGPGDPIHDPPPDGEPDHSDPAPDPLPDNGEDPVPDAVEDVPEELCTLEGCLLTTGARCCPDLEAVHECDPASGDPGCDDRFCVDCGNGVCDPHENCTNCLADCTAPCTDEDSVILTCSVIETHHCSCTPDPCPPECRNIPDGGQGWYDSCDDTLIRVDDGCMAQVPECRAVCSRSEGWYESGTDELIAWDFCRSEWECSIVW